MFDHWQYRQEDMMNCSKHHNQSTNVTTVTPEGDNFSEDSLGKWLFLGPSCSEGKDNMESRKKKRYTKTNTIQQNLEKMQKRLS